ncbi:hypothetical protein GOBAR_DD26848 [Gossypium barbadense]|nr:hypothetical protein GOBAR_DD26848 [Gossypium barbadense]
MTEESSNCKGFWPLLSLSQSSVNCRPRIYLSAVLHFCRLDMGSLQVAQAVRPIIENTGLWQVTEVLAKAYDYGMGSTLFSPIAILGWLPIISAFQNSIPFQPGFQ